MNVLKATIVKSNDAIRNQESISLSTDVYEPDSVYHTRKYPLMIFLMVDGGKGEAWIKENFPGIEIEIFQEF